jgi:hypothetical protein
MVLQTGRCSACEYHIQHFTQPTHPYFGPPPDFSRIQYATYFLHGQGRLKCFRSLPSAGYNFPDSSLHFFFELTFHLQPLSRVQQATVWAFVLPAKLCDPMTKYEPILAYGSLRLCSFVISKSGCCFQRECYQLPSRSSLREQTSQNASKMIG